MTEPLERPIVTRRARRIADPLPDGETPLPRELMALDTGTDSDEEFVPEQTAEDRVLEMIQGFAGDSRATVKVHRRMTDGRNEFCRTYTVAEFEAGNLDMIREHWGPGTYFVMMYAPNQRNNNRVSKVAQQTINIAAMPVINPIAPTSPGGGNQLEQITRALTENQRQFQESIAALLRDRPDPMAQMMQMLTMQKLMREAMGVDIGVAKASPISEIIAAVRQLREVSGELNPEREPEDSVGSLIKMASPIVERVLDAMPQRQQSSELSALPHIDVPPTLRQENPIPPVADQPSENIEGNQDMAAAMKLASLYLITMIKKGETTEKMAEFVYEKLPDELLDLIELPHWWDVMIQVAPDFAAYQEKVTEIRNRVCEMLAEDDLPEELPSGEPAKPV